MVTLFVVGTYLAIGSCVALFCWSKRDRDEWLADDLLVSGLTFLSVTVFWPRAFVVFVGVFVKLLRKRLAERRARGRRIVISSGGKTFHIVPAETRQETDR